MRGFMLALGFLAAGAAHAQNWSTAPVVSGGGNSGVLATAAFPAQGRLTLTTHTPVLTTGVSAATTIFYDAYLGNLVPIFNGTSDVVFQIPGNEVSDALQSSGSGLVSSGGVFDIWAVNRAGSLAICHATNGSGGGWASDAGSNTARGTGYSQLDRSTRPYLTNTHALANCYNGTTNLGSIGANQATYLGSFTTTANGQTTVSFPAAASGGSHPIIGLWNYYNRVSVVAQNIDNGASYQYTSNTIRQARGSANNAVVFVSGVAEDAVSVSNSVYNTTAASTGANPNSGIGFDTITGYTGGIFACSAGAAVAISCAGTILHTYSPQLGLHTIAANENGDNTFANTFNTATTNALEVTLRY